MSRIADLYRKAKQIYHTEGLMALLRRTLVFLLGGLFKYETYYLYATDILMERNEADFRPNIPTFAMHTVGTNKEAEALEADGLEFRSYVSNAEERLEKGAIAFCFFIGRELVNIAWVALTEEAFRTFNKLPINVDFVANEAYSGGLWTNPKYRGLGFTAYCYFKALELMRERGKVVSKAAIDVRNVLSQRATGKIGTKIYAEGRYLRILWWKSWREKRLPQG